MNHLKASFNSGLDQLRSSAEGSHAKVQSFNTKSFRPDAEGVMEVGTTVPLITKQKTFRLVGPILECNTVGIGRKNMTFNMLECKVKPVKDTLVIEAPNGKIVVMKPQSAEYDKWKYALMQAATPLLSERRFKPSSAAGGPHRRSNGFEGLLQRQMEAIQACLEDQVYTADVDAVASTVVGSLADPSSLARLRLAGGNDPAITRYLEDIWTAHDRDGDGIASRGEMTDIVRGYLEAMRQQLPSILLQIVYTITKFFLPVKDVDAASTQLMGRINEKILPQAEGFIGQMLAGHYAMALDMLNRMNLADANRIQKEEFLMGFLPSSQFAFLDAAICGALTDEISLQLTKCLGELWKARPGLCGLSNLGNTCYMNAALQCLSHTSQLRKFFLSKKFIHSVVSRHMGGAQLTMSFAELIREIWSGQHSTLRPHRIKQAMDEVTSQFQGYTQQDSHEFLAFLLDTIHEDVNSIRRKPRVVVPDSAGRPDKQVAGEAWRAHLQRENSVIVEVFHGQIKSAVSCGKCSKTSVRFDAAMGFSVPFPDGQRDVHLDECMDLFTAEERLEDDNLWFCAGCQMKAPSTKRIHLFRLPRCLVVYLKRFNYNVYGTVTKKLENVVHFPIDGWDLRKWLPPEHQDNPNTIYDLYAVVHHFGSATSGHYTSCCKLGKTWVTFDDSNVMAVGKGFNSSKSAYILFYQQRDGGRGTVAMGGSPPPLGSSRRRNSQPTIRLAPEQQTLPIVVNAAPVASLGHTRTRSHSADSAAERESRATYIQAW